MFAKKIAVIIFVLIFVGYCSYNKSSPTSVSPPPAIAKLEDTLTSATPLEFNAKSSEDNHFSTTAVMAKQVDDLDGLSKPDKATNYTNKKAEPTWEPYVARGSDEYNDVLEKSLNR